MFANPKSFVNAPICDVTINPVVDIIVIIANMSQKTGVASICDGDRSLRPPSTFSARRGARRRPWAATRPAAAKMSPNRMSAVR